MIFLWSAAIISWPKTEATTLPCFNGPSIAGYKIMELLPFGRENLMDSNSPTMSLETEQSDKQPLKSAVPFEFGPVRFLALGDRESFRMKLTALIKKFDVADYRQDVPMAEFIEWRMRSLWFLHRYLGSGHPYYSEFLLAVDREIDPYNNGRLVIAGKALLKALLGDLDEGSLSR